LRVKFKCISTYGLTPQLPCYYPLHIILFLHLLSTNHKCTQPCYFPYNTNVLLRRWRWTRILWRGVIGCALSWLLHLWGYGVFHCSILQESHLGLLRHYLCNKYTLFVTFGYMWTLLVRMCATIDPGTYIWWVHGFGIKTGYGRSGTRTVSTVGLLA
jgi:hypothetical protein